MRLRSWQVKVGKDGVIEDSGLRRFAPMTPEPLADVAEVASVLAGFC